MQDPQGLHLHGPQVVQWQFSTRNGRANHYQEVTEVMKQVDTLVIARRLEWEKQRDTLASQLQQCDTVRVQVQRAYNQKHAEAAELHKRNQLLQHSSNANAARCANNCTLLFVVSSSVVCRASERARARASARESGGGERESARMGERERERERERMACTFLF